MITYWTIFPVARVKKIPQARVKKVPQARKSCFPQARVRKRQFLYTRTHNVFTRIVEESAHVGTHTTVTMLVQQKLLLNFTDFVFAHMHNAHNAL